MSFVSLKEKWNRDGKLKLIAAFVLNLLFLLVVVTCFKARFETNDDVLMSKFVDGQMAEKSAYVPFLNIVLGFTLKLLYTVGGDNLPWYSLTQYAFMLASYTAISWVLLKKYRLLPAASMTAVVLMTVGMNSYLYPTFTKICAVAGAAGLYLMLYAMGDGREKVKRPALVLGIVLAVLGYMWRAKEFFAVAALMAPVGLVVVVKLLCCKEDGLKRRWQRVLRYASPFLLLLVILLLCNGFNQLMWSRGDYAYFASYSKYRSALIDYSEVPEYDEMQDVYDSLDMNEDAVYFLKNWSFYDTEKFTLESIKTIMAARKAVVQTPSLGECLGKFLDVAMPGLAETLAFGAIALMLVLWLAVGRHGWQEWLGVLCTLGFFGIIYLYMIYQNRYLANRVDMGMLLAMALAISLFMDGKKLENEKLFCTFVLLLAVFIGLYSNRTICKLSHQYDVEDKSSKKAAIDLLLQDEEHIYFYKIWSLDMELYDPLEVAPAGYADKILQLGGWSLYHPSIEHILEKYGIENPYPDMIDNDSVLLIDDDVERTIAYLRVYYNENATAEKLEELSQETGLNIYRIVS
jgi:hypothetical protein